MADESQQQDQAQSVDTSTTQASVTEAELDALFDQEATGQTADDTTTATESVDAGGAEGGNGNGADQGQQGGADAAGASTSTTGSDASGADKASAANQNDANGASGSDAQATGAEGQPQPAPKAADKAAQSRGKKTSTPDVDNRTRSLEGRLAAVNAENAELKKRLNSNSATTSPIGATGTTGATDQGQGAAPATDKAKALFGSEKWKKMAEDYPEIAGPLQEVIGQIGASALNAEAKVTSQEVATTSQRNARIVMDVHPDAGRLVRTPEFIEWRKAQPAYVQELIERNAKGVHDPASVIDVFDRFKADKGIATQASQPASHGGNQVPNSNTNTATAKVREVRRQGAVQVNGNKGGPGAALPEDPDKLFDALADKATAATKRSAA